tara:strand:- start:61 stop:1023 length:963 start_codon:yes stop_codon:yes gene_type:complete
MIPYLKKVILFLFPFFLLFLLGGTYDPEEGGLTRLAYSKSMRKYSSVQLIKNNIQVIENKRKPSVVIFGDSFIPYILSHMLTENVSTFNIHDYKTKNPFVLALSLKDEAGKVEPDIIIIETVERALLGRLRGINSDQTAERDDRHAQAKSEIIEPNFMAQTKNGLFRLGALLNLNITASQNRVHHWQATHLPLHNPSTLHTISNALDWRKEKYTNVNLRLNQAYQKIEQSYPEAEIQFLIIPDKLTFFEDYLTTPPSNSSILHDIDWTQSFFQIKLIPQLVAAREKGVMEIYKYSGTHFGESGMKISASAVDDFIKTTTD